MKKSILIIAGLVLLAFVPATVLAQTAGYEGGFFIKNDEDSFKLKLNGRVQTNLMWIKDPSRTDPNVQRQGTGGVFDPNVKSTYMTFQMRRAQLGVRAFFHDAVDVGFTIKHATNNVAGNQFATANFTGATAGIEIVPEFVITTGMVGLPLDMMNEFSSAWYLLPEPPISYTQDDGGVVLPIGSTVYRSSFGAPEGLGLNFSGSYWKWFYSLSVINATESNYALNGNKHFSFGFRTGFNILDPVGGSMTDFECSETPKLTLSLGTMYQAARWITIPTDPANTPSAPFYIKYLWTSSMGVAVRWAGFSFTGEGYYRRQRNPNPIGGLLFYRSTLSDIGYYAAAGYYAIPKKLEIALQASQLFRQGPDNNSYSFGGGINGYVFDNNLKLQLAYTLLADFDATPYEPGAAKVHNITLMASAMF